MSTAWLSPEDVSEQLGVQAKTVRDWLRSGDLVGIKVGKSWRIHPADLQRLLGEQLYVARLERAKRVHPDVDWERGQCAECGELMPRPSSRNHHWVCSPGCRGQYDQKVVAILGYGNEESAISSSTVIPAF